MYNNIFQFPLGTKVEFTLSRNKMFDNVVLEGKVVHYFKRPGQQTVLQNKRVKFYPVDTVHIETKSGEFRVDIDCIITKPTQAMVNKINKLAKEAIRAKESVKVKPKKRREGTFKLRDGVTIIQSKDITWLYVASKSSKIFHDIESTTAKRISTKNAVFFKSKKEAEASGRTHAK